MNRRTLPLGARTPDELLVAAQDPGLDPAARREVDAWLAAHPEWQARARAYDAMRAATRRLAAGDTRPPDLASMSGLWAAIEDHQRSGPATVSPFAPPTRPASLDAARARRRRSSGAMALAAAALVVIAVGAVVVGNTGGGDRDTAGDVGATLPGATDGSGGPPDQAAPDLDPGTTDGEPTDVEVLALAQLREGAELTAEISTADVVFRSLATSDVSGGVIAEQTGADTVHFETVGRGQVELPDRSVLSTSTTTRVGERTDLFPVVTGETVRNGERSFVRCGGEPEFTELVPPDTRPTATSDEPAPGEQCFATVVNPDSFGPDVALEVINTESFASGGLVQLGTDTLSDGTVITGYQTTEPLGLDDGQVVDMTLQIWMDADQLIRRVVAGADFSAGEDGYPTNLVISYELFDLGGEVDIPTLD